MELSVVVCVLPAAEEMEGAARRWQRTLGFLDFVRCRRICFLYRFALKVAGIFPACSWCSQHSHGAAVDILETT